MIPVVNLVVFAGSAVGAAVALLASNVPEAAGVPAINPPLPATLKIAVCATSATEDVRVIAKDVVIVAAEPAVTVHVKVSLVPVAGAV